MFVLMVVVPLLLALGEAAIGYVKPNNPSGPCHYSSCENLNYYAENSEVLGFNYTLLFITGLHTLELDFVVANASFLNLVAENAIGFGEVVITCTQEVGLVFMNVHSLKLKGLSFRNCSQVNTYAINRSGLWLQNVSNLFLQDVHVHNSSGYGLVAKNVYGKSVIKDSTFLYNSGCSAYNGGNALFNYSNCTEYSDKITFNITSSNFSYSVYNGNSSVEDRSLATGLIIVLSCDVQMYLSNITVEFNNNSIMSGLGGNIFIHFFNTFKFFSNLVSISNSRISGGLAELGAGLAVSYSTGQIKRNCSTSDNKLFVANSDISSNTGVSGSGFYVYLMFVPDLKCYPRGSITVVNTSFSHNVANLSHYSFNWNIGVAIYIFNGFVRDSLNDKEPFSILFDNITVQRSETWNFEGSFSPTEFSAAIFIAKFVGCFVVSNSKILDNRVSAMSLFKSKVLLTSTILVSNNSGINGGGLILCGGSYFELNSTSALRFIGNKANFLGGAIYSEMYCRDSHPSCFYQFVTLPKCYNESNHDYLHQCFKTRITFINNTAGNAGMDIYGGNVANCYFHRTSMLYRVGSDIFYAIFDVSKNTDRHFSAVTSDPIRVCECYLPMQYNCNSTSFSYDGIVYPGKMILVPIVIVGQLKGTVPGTVLINGRNPYTVLHTNYCSYLPIKVTHDVPAYVLQVLNAGISSSKNNYELPKGSNALVVNVNVHSCPVGFVLSKNVCICDERIQRSECNITNSTITRRYGSWIGYNRENSSKYARGIIYQEVCPLDYCDGRFSNILVSETGMDSDQQCSLNRRGLLCGACVTNFSVALGGTHCLDCRNASKFYAFMSSSAFAVCAVLLIIVLITFDMNITDGLLDGMLFYANILYFKKELFRFTGSNVLTVVISAINLDLGMITCFYDGMDMYAKIWIQLCMPQSLWLLILVVILLSRRFDKIAKLVGNNSAKVLATLIELTFTRSLQACVMVFTCTALEYPSHDGKTRVKWVWLHDGNIGYLEGKHIPLFMAATVFSLFLMVYTLMLLFVQPLQWYSHLYCLQWVNKLKPLIDAYTAPHVIKARCRFWGGFLLLLRIAILIYTVVNVRNKQSNEFAAITNTCFILLSVSFLAGGVYKSLWLNLLNGSFFINLALLSIALTSIFTKNNSYYFEPTEKHGSYIIVYMSSSIALVEIFSIMMYYFIKKLRNFTCCKFVRGLWKRASLNELNPLLEYFEDNAAHSRLSD